MERRRRDKINTWIRELSLVVPAAGSHGAQEQPGTPKHAGSASSSGAYSKGDVLSRACQYIRALEHANERLRNQALVEVDLLRRENEMLRSELRKHAITVPVPSTRSAELLLDACSSENVAAMVTVAAEHTTVRSSDSFSSNAPPLRKRSRNGQLSAPALSRSASSHGPPSSASSDSDTLALPSAAALNLQLQSLPD